MLAQQILPNFSLTREVWMQSSQYQDLSGLTRSNKKLSAHGAQTSHSLSIHAVYSDAVMASDKGEVTCLLLLDYSAAFDTVDHDILLTILEDSFGITGIQTSQTILWNHSDHSKPHHQVHTLHTAVFIKLFPVRFYSQQTFLVSVDRNIHL